MTVHVSILNKSTNPNPTYATEGSAGMDLCASTQEAMLIGPGERSLIGTGLFIELPKGFEAQIRPRSGLALKHGITVLNSPGTIDSDYRGEIKVLLINHSKQTFTVQNGDRIAQMVVARFEQIDLTPAESLSSTTRGSGGYGHTGIKPNINS